MEKLKADASEILICVRKLKGLQKHNQMVEADIEKRSQELELKEKGLQSLSLDLEKRYTIFGKEKAEAGNLKKMVEECTKELRSKRNQLTAKMDSLTRYQRELEIKDKELGQVMAELSRHCYESRAVDDRNREIEGETCRKKKELALILDHIEGETCRKKKERALILDQIERETCRKKKELRLILDQIKESGKHYVTVDEQLESQQRLLNIRSSELASKEKELKCVRESIKLSKSDLGLKEKKVQSLNNCITVCGQEIDSKTKELGEIQKLIEQQTGELGVMNNQSDLLKLFIRELSEELVTKEKSHKEILETICRSSSEMEERAKEIKAAETEASDLKVRSQRFRQDVEDKEKELDLLKNQIESEEKKLIQLKGEMEEETDGKKKDLVLILSKIEESGKQLAVVDEQLESQRRLLEIQSVELVSKDMELECVGESSKLVQFDLEVKEKRVQVLNNMITISGEQLDLKSKQLGEIQKLIEQQTGELGVMNNQSDLLKRFIQELSEELVTNEKRHKEILETICRSSSEMEERAKEIKVAETEASDLNVRSQRFRQEVEDKEKELDLRKNQIESEEKKLIQLKREMEEETDRKKKDLELNLSKIEDSGKQLVAVDEQLESQQRLLEIQSRELVSKENELECVGESSKRFKFDLEVKEKRVQELNNLIKISGEQLDLKSKELGEVQKLIEEQRKKLCDMHKQQPAAAPINDTSQQIAAEAEDALMHHESSASLVRDEVSSALRASPNPAEFVLDLVQEGIREGSGLEDSSLEILVLFFDELAKIQRPDEPQLQLKATEVATLWKEKITIEAPKSSLEALAFLLFIVAYGLKKLIDQEETALLASSIAQCEQGPTLFNSLGLKLEMIEEIVVDLIGKRQYIPAVRFICLFKLYKDFSPSRLLMKEIINLRKSALEMRPTGSSQGKDKDAGRLRAILELVADYKLEIDLPGDLVAKLMVQRENSTPLAHCSVTRLTSSSDQQANSHNPVSAQRSSVVPKPEVKPYLN